ncbi:MAG: HAMP domain-containing histidine kinase [Muribaculaceae bacterium]|nr:HAMP domain-containing histidine kinase [Muribaculaceae bacterium]MBQ5409401.1 HAMP domain-containing histidine kinase [Muribaculaceae bacterium]
MRNIYDSRRIWKMVLLAMSLVLVSVFIYFSNSLVKDLAKQERERMQIWADATREMVTSTDADVDFLLSIIQGNHNIPVLLVDDKNNIIEQRNFKLPEPNDSLKMIDEYTAINKQFLQKKLNKLRKTTNNIEIKIDDSTRQVLYYEDSDVLRRLAYYPYIQLAVMLLFIAIAYFALISVKKAEQNRVWVGLSKETAHQLGTPISSLMAWTQMLESMGIDKEIINDMDTDVHRLSVIADRFSKIGSMPDKELTFINEAVESSLNYMRTRIPKHVTLTVHTDDEKNCGVMLCQPLFEWVMENLTKNAVDAMSGEGRIDIVVTSDAQHAHLYVKDTGKGIARKNFKNVFNPGFTTKKRGWGLGLTLVKRIIEEYHNGKIYVKDSEVGKGTTFAIEIPKVK